MTSSTPEPELNVEAEIRQQIVEIIGVETDPNGEPEQYLIRNEQGRVTQGIDFRAEIDGLLALIQQVSDQKVRGVFPVWVAAEKEVLRFLKDNPEATAYDAVKMLMRKQDQTLANYLSHKETE